MVSSVSDRGVAMTFEEVLAQIIEVLQREKRISYRALKRRFALDDAYLDDLKEELIYAKRLALDEDSRVLVWAGDAEAPLLLLRPRPHLCPCTFPWRFTSPTRMAYQLLHSHLRPNAVSLRCCSAIW
jgi:hypothetical protein